MDQALQFLTADALTAHPATVIAFRPLRAQTRVGVPDVLAPGVAAPRASGRVAEIDQTRGLFVLWMVIAHALFLADVRRSSPLAALIPPPGTFSDCFVVLSGFTIAWVFAARVLQDGQGARTLYRRGLQVGLVALGSNLASHVFMDASRGALAWASVSDTLLLRREWSLSWILVPTSALLLLSPWLVRVGNALGSLRFLALATIAGWLVFGPVWAPLNDWSASVTSAGVHFPPGRLVTGLALGTWGLAVALWARRFSLAPFAAGFAALSAAALLAGLIAPLPLFANAAARFGLFFGGALSLAVLPLPSFVPATCRLLGRNALLVFVAHRLYLQVQARAILGHVSPEAAGTVMTVAGLTLILATCHLRESHRGLSAALKRVGL